MPRRHRACGVRRLAAAVCRTGLPGRAPRICQRLGSGEASFARLQREQAPALHMSSGIRLLSLRGFGPNRLSVGPVVFRFNPWYYLHAFVALVSLLTRLTRLPGEGSVGLIFWRAGQAGAPDSLLGD